MTADGRSPCAVASVGASTAGTAVHLDTGYGAYCGGCKAAAQEELRSLAALGVIGSRSAAVLLAQLRQRQRVPVHLGGLDQRVNPGGFQSMGKQFGADARRPVTVCDARAQQHFTEALVILVVLIAETLDGL